MRALTREVGSLKEDLRREVKRRERAVISTREAEELKQEAETRIKQLEYAKRSAASQFQQSNVRMLHEASDCATGIMLEKVRCCRKLEQESFAAEEATRVNAARSRAAATSARYCDHS